ncbi:MAG: AAA family ATPase [Bacteroidaceae bacterium]|nr:AAA family ATPase [Bacteroidaceae bacterium]
MAKLFPKIEYIARWKVQPQAGEWAMLNFLQNNLDDSFDVYFNPYMNGDRPDIVIVRKRHGVLVIEVKDWMLDAYRLNERKHWILKGSQNSTPILSPITQVLKYKENLYTLHLDGLFESHIKDYRYWKVVSCAVYFHNATQKEVEDLLVNPFVSHNKYQKFLAKNITLIGNDALTKENFDKILYQIYMLSEYDSKCFSDSLYDSITHFLLPTTHQKEDGKLIQYLEKQQQIIEKDDRREFVVEGVEGSGKTTVLVRRAVEEYLRAKKKFGDDYSPKILILTYNITLVNFIKEKLNQVQETFEWTSFFILNFHHFIGNQLNNLNRPVTLPQNLQGNYGDDENLQLTSEQSNYLDNTYYSNVALFLEMKEDILRKDWAYDAILIDEMQDYKYKWFEILKKVFLKDNGGFILFGDEKQNIYGNPLLEKKVKTTILGRRIKLSQSVRSGAIVEKLVLEFQKQIYKEKYDLDQFENPDIGELPFRPYGTIKYMYLTHDFIPLICKMIFESKILEEYKDIATDDMAILSFNVDFLRQLDAFYRNKTGERTMTMFETKETIVFVNLRRDWDVFKRNEGKVSRYFDASILKSMLEIVQGRDDEDKLKSLSRLIVLYDLNTVYNGVFGVQLNYFFKKNKCQQNLFENIMKRSYQKMSQYLGDMMTKDYNNIREHKKAHFYMHPGCIKISTIHSFKGWDSRMVFLIIDKHVANSSVLDEMVYTGITRCKEHLYIINIGNDAYDRKIKPLMESVGGIVK